MVTAGQQQGHSGSKFRFPYLFWNLHIGIGELPIAVGFENTENVPDDLLLPVDQFKILSRPGPFRMSKTFDEANGVVGGSLAVNRVLRLESGRFVFF